MPTPSPANAQPYLTKSSYVRGITCRRLLWLAWHRRQPYQPPLPGSPAAIGIEIGAEARRLFPGGVLVGEDAWQHDDAVRRTRDLMSDATVPAIFEAAFAAGGVRIRADIIERLAAGRWGLREVKSASRVKAAYVDDAAIQAHVIERCGIELGSIELVHVDTDYVYPGGAIDWRRYFARTDIGERVRAEMRDLPALIDDQLATLNTADEPAVPPGPHCPKNCDYWGHCTNGKPADWIFNLPRLSPQKFEALTAAGIERISEIPDTFDLTLIQDRMRDVVVCRRPYVSPGLPAAIARLEGAVDYLDFEAMSPALPIFPGTRPYQRIAFQWSLHRADGADNLTHMDFLGDHETDPRRAFTTSLVEALGDNDTPIVVYSAYERGVLVELAILFPEHADAIDKILSRLTDLFVIVRDHVYLEGFNGSLSIKHVGKALAPGFTYDGLQHVTDGAAAGSAFERLARGTITEAETSELRAALIAYCRLDTLAMVEAHRGLRRLAGARPTR
ncbi:MAG: DUF2779 domain-containing protein [Alphaproteobacteria bacterium]|nr:DUF2779 domain-containing protein [Alphaproteobacteria bacterium]